MIFLNGTVGVGKSTVLDHVADLWQEAEQPYAVFDLDHLRRTWPAPDGDPFNLALELANSALRSNDPAPSGRAVAVAGVLERAADRPAYEAALGGRLVVVRLTARPEVVESRLRRRHDGPVAAASLAWHLDRARELAAILDAADLDDAVVDVSDLAPRDAARAVLSAIVPDAPTEGGDVGPGRAIVGRPERV